MEYSRDSSSLDTAKVEGEGVERRTRQTPLSTTSHVDSVSPSPANSIGAAFTINEDSSSNGRYVEKRNIDDEGRGGILRLRGLIRVTCS